MKKLFIVIAFVISPQVFSDQLDECLNRCEQMTNSCYASCGPNSYCTIECGKKGTQCLDACEKQSSIELNLKKVAELYKTTPEIIIRGK